jgi:hypothetical protein
MTTPLPVNYLLDEYKDTTSEEVERLYAEVVDRWTWDTGSEEDAKLMQRIGTEHRWRKHRWRKHTERPKKQPASIEAAMSEEITDEIDRGVLRSLMDIADEKET